MHRPQSGGHRSALPAEQRTGAALPLAVLPPGAAAGVAGLGPEAAAADCMASSAPKYGLTPLPKPPPTAGKQASRAGRGWDDGETCRGSDALPAGPATWHTRRAAAACRRAQQRAGGSGMACAACGASPWWRTVDEARLILILLLFRTVIVRCRCISAREGWLLAAGEAEWELAPPQTRPCAQPGGTPAGSSRQPAYRGAGLQQAFEPALSNPPPPG